MADGHAADKQQEQEDAAQMESFRVVTVHVVVRNSTLGEMCDAISEALRPITQDDRSQIVDWGYARNGAPHSAPIIQSLSLDEGDFYSLAGL